MFTAPWPPPSSSKEEEQLLRPKSVRDDVDTSPYHQKRISSEPIVQAAFFKASKNDLPLGTAILRACEVSARCAPSTGESGGAEGAVVRDCIAESNAKLQMIRQDPKKITSFYEAAQCLSAIQTSNRQECWRQKDTCVKKATCALNFSEYQQSK